MAFYTPPFIAGVLFCTLKKLVLLFHRDAVASLGLVRYSILPLRIALNFYSTLLPLLGDQPPLSRLLLSKKALLVLGEKPNLSLRLGEKPSLFCVVVVKAFGALLGLLGYTAVLAGENHLLLVSPRLLLAAWP